MSLFISPVLLTLIAILPRPFPALTQRFFLTEDARK